MFGFRFPKHNFTLKKIDRFDGTYYDFLSNFYPSPIMYNGDIFETVEHFFQAHKTKSAKEFNKIRMIPNPGSVKRFGNKTPLRSDWEKIKDDVMYLGLLLKFTQHPDLANKLKATKGRELEEGNDWGDKYWGTVNGEGLNKLGIFLMKIRNVLLREENVA